MHNTPAEHLAHCMGTASSHDNPTMRIKGVADFLSIGESTAWRWVSEGKLPQGIRLSSRVTVWRKSDIVRFLEQSGGAQ